MFLAVRGELADEANENSAAAIIFPRELGKLKVAFPFDRESFSPIELGKS